MATNEAKKSDDIDCILYITKHSTSGYYGYKTDYLEQPLNPMECNFLTCPFCKGIMRKACVKRGEIACSPCSGNPRFCDPVEVVRNAVTNLKINCPLGKGCEWKGVVAEAVQHLEVCEDFLESCPLKCGGVIKRGEMINHKEQVCPLHEVKCQFCSDIVKFIEVIGHEGSCPKRLIKCTCEKEMRHDEHAMHIEKECPLVDVECPFVKYSCDVGKVMRKDLMEHKREFYIQHQDMLEEENCVLRTQISRLNTKLKLKKDIDSVEFAIPEVDSVTHHQGPFFYSGKSKFIVSAGIGESLAIGLSRARTIWTDDSVTHYHFTMSLPGDDLAFYHEECSVANNDTDKQANLFCVNKGIYSEYVQPDGSISIKLYYSNSK